MEESKLSSEDPEEKSATEDLYTVDVPVKAMNEETSKEEEVLEKEEEDTTSDGGFVKVDREGIDTKDDDEKAELENSRKRIKELEEGIRLSSVEAQKFEEQSASHAESALELSWLLESAKEGAQEMEYKMASLQHELNEFYENAAETEKIVDVLRSTTGELVALKEELALSKSHLLKMEQKISSKEALIDELEKKASESQFKDELLDLEAKVSEQEGINLKLKEELKEKESVYTLLKDQEENITTANEKLTEVLKENEALVASVAEITINAAKMKEICNELEEKLKCSDENFFKTDALLSQALSRNSELEQKLKSLKEIFNEFGSAATENATQKSLNLEDVVRSSLQEAEEAKSQLEELKTQFIATENNNVELVQKLNLLQLKNSDVEGELKQLSEEISELKSALVVAEEEEKQSFNQKQEYKEKVTKLESSLNKLSARNSELEEDLRMALQKGAEHEDRGNMSTWRNLELEGKLNDMEILVQTEKYRIQELEEQFSSLENKYEQTEADSKSLEAAFNVAEEKIEQQAREIDEATTRNKELEVLKHENELLANTNNQFKIKIQELQELQERDSFEKKTATKQYEEVTERLNQKDKEAKELIEKTKSLENQIEEYKREVQETVEVSDTRKAELDDILVRVKNLVATVEELSSKCSVLEKESEALAEVNLKLNQKLANHGSETNQTSDLQEKLSALEAEKDKTEKELQASKKTIEDLTAQLTSEGDGLKSYIFSLEKENNEINQLYHNTKDEFQSVILKLEEELTAEKSKANSLVSEIEKHSAVVENAAALSAKVVELTSKLQEHEHNASERDLLNEKALQLQKKFQDSQTFIVKQTKMLTQKQTELEATLKKSQEVELRFKELEQKVKLTDAKSEETEVEEVKSGDIGLSNSAPTQRKKSKKKSKASQASFSSNNVATQTVETWHHMTVKIVLGVALVAIIIGIIVRKKF